MRMPQVYCDECDVECDTDHATGGAVECPVCLATWGVEFQRVGTADPELERQDRAIFTRGET